MLKKNDVVIFNVLSGLSKICKAYLSFICCNASPKLFVVSNFTIRFSGTPEISKLVAKSVKSVLSNACCKNLLIVLFTNGILDGLSNDNANLDLHCNEYCQPLVLEILLGSRLLLALYGGLVIVGALLLQLASSFGIAGSFQGASVIHFALFAAFVMVYPGVLFFFGLEARWVFLGLTLLSVLELIAAHQQAVLLLYLGSLCFTSLVMKYLGYRRPLWQGVGSLLGENFLVRFFSKLRKKQQRSPRKTGFLGEKKPREQKQIIPQDLSSSLSFPPSQYRQQRPFSSQSTTMAFFSSPEGQEQQELEYQEDLCITTDELLKKVGEEGLASLSLEERAHLDQASRVLLQREKGSQFFQQEP